MIDTISNTAFVDNLYYHCTYDDSHLPNYYSNEIQEISRNNRIKSTLEYARKPW